MIVKILISRIICVTTIVTNIKKYHRKTQKNINRNPVIRSKLSILNVLIGLSFFTLSACSLPVEQRMAYVNESQSTLIPIDPNSLLAKRILPDNQKNTDKTGAFILYDGKDAFVARLALIEKAKNSIDAQYYLWHDDISGRLLFNKLYQAGERGVRVRLLLDDNGTVGMDKLLTRLNSHPNIEVRLFNPYVQRKFRSIAYFTDTVRINRRMHNKSFTVDGVVSIIGGRNVGDEYFAVNKDLVFADLDVSLVGKVVPKIQQDFDDYWASESSYPLELIVKPQTTVSSQETVSSQADKIKQKNTINIVNRKKTKNYLMNVLNTSYPKYLENQNYPIVWTNAYYFSDPSSKSKQARSFKFKDSLIAQIIPFIASTKNQLILISPYFVPTKVGTDYLVKMAKQGKRVIIITNSLSSTDVTIVHSAYQKYRKQLLQAGIELYEFKDDPKNDEYGKKGYRRKYKDTYDVNGSLPNSGASLHAKASIIDDRYVFIGSSNFDPRSALLNTEDGVILEDSGLARAISEALEQNRDVINYQLTLQSNGKLLWRTLEDGKRVVYYHEPETPLKDRIFSEILAMLPIDGWL